MSRLRILVWLSLVLPNAGSATEPVRRALIVGINQYTRPPAEISSSAGNAQAKLQRSGWFDLDGAVNDAVLIRQILLDRLGFQSDKVIFLKNEQATRTHMLEAFKRHLVDEASSGDVSVFYYAGHGSQVENLGSSEADKLDETLVPADAGSGTRDIRDKELARLYRAAAQKGVTLTVILDSCHSGGMSRGKWNGAGKTRALAPDPRPVEDPDIDPVTRKRLPDPASLGVLFLAAAREDQSAHETTAAEWGRSGAVKEVAHGVFTAALARVLASPMADQSVKQICDRVQAILAGQGEPQVPVCAGRGRENRGLIGQPAGLGARVSIAVESVESSGLIKLRGGLALGLTPGCTLVRTHGQQVEIELTQVDIGTSYAKPVAAKTTSLVQAGDLFKIETWVAPPDSPIKMYFPKDGPDPAAVLMTARAVREAARQRGAEVLPEVSRSKTPTHVLYWREGSYYLERHPADGQIVRLGPAPSVSEVAKALSTATGVRLWLILPPSGRLASDIRLGAGSPNPVVQLVDRPEHSIYFLAGRLTQDSVEYAWIYKEAFLIDPNTARLPLGTDWKISGEHLTNLALRLARVYGWLNLRSPSEIDPEFPYRLVFERAETGKPAGSGPFRFKEEYKIVFQADPAALRQAGNGDGVRSRYVYVFMIDSSGEAKCFFPNAANGNDGNRLPRGNGPESRIVATGDQFDIVVSPPEGTDNYFMVTSTEPLDPGTFEWSGVTTRRESRGSQGPLAFLFGSVGVSRGDIRNKIPATWSIQSMAVRSVP